MAKNINRENDAAEQNKRLQEIAAMKFEELSDEEVLRLLAERKRLMELQNAYEQLQREEAERLRLEKKKAEELEEVARQKSALAQEIEKLNQSISPDKADAELLALVAQRKELEKRLEDLGGVVPPPASVELMPEPAPLEAVTIPEEAPASPAEEVIPEKEAETVPPNFQASVKPAFGQEGILEDDFSEGSELYRYLEQLKNNTGSLGTLLQDMPLDAKSNKAFMLRVAEIDPAYAMHYAGDTLKRNDDFNIRIASMSNPRNSGNAVAEMLPEGRTSAVVLAAVKQDYRNIKFAQPNMAAYDEMLHIAKNGTLEKIQELKEATDSLLLVPRLLQADKQFMAEIKKITEAEKAAQMAQKK